MTKLAFPYINSDTNPYALVTAILGHQMNFQSKNRIKQSTKEQHNQLLSVKNITTETGTELENNWTNNARTQHELNMK